MTQNELREKVIAAEKAVMKRKDILEKYNLKRHKLIQNGASFDEINDINTTIENCKIKLQEAQSILANWQEKYNKRIYEDKYLQKNCPKAIKDFLERWKLDTINWYIDRFKKFLELRQELYNEEYKARRECVNIKPEYEKFKNMLSGETTHDNYILLNVWPRKIIEEYLHERNLDSKQIQKRLSNFGDQIIF